MCIQYTDMWCLQVLLFFHPFAVLVLTWCGLSWLPWSKTNQWLMALDDKKGHLAGGKIWRPSIQFLVHIDANLGDCTTLVLYGTVCYYTTLLAFSTKANRSNEVCHMTCFLGTASHRRSNDRPAYIIHVAYLNNIIWNLLFTKRIVQLCMISISALVTVLCSTAISCRFCLHRETSIPTVSTKRLMKPLLLEVPCKLTSVAQGSVGTWRSPVRPALLPPLLPGHRMGAECGQQKQQTRPENVWGNWKMHLQKWRFNLQSSTFDHQKLRLDHQNENPIIKTLL